MRTTVVFLSYQIIFRNSNCKALHNLSLCVVNHSIPTDRYGEYGKSSSVGYIIAPSCSKADKQFSLPYLFPSCSTR